MTIAYFDCFSGAAGDMILGAFIDVGMPLLYLDRELKRLPLHGYKFILVKEKKPIHGTNIRVVVTGRTHHNDYKSIDSMIAKSHLSKSVKELSRAIFKRLARAEAKIHAIPVDRVHFHEVGAVDSIVDIVGSAIGLDYFKFASIHSSPLPMSRGKVKCGHGTFPLPAPATLEILKGIPIERVHVNAELVTPTGAAILATVVEQFGECPIQKIERIGYGYGDKVFPGLPNALRIIIGEGFPVVVIECDIDDMNPQIFDYAVKKMFKAGAVDVNLIPVQMKKTRSAVRVAAVAPWDKKDAVMDALLKETTTFGVRYWPAERKVLARTIETKRTKFGGVRFKIGMDRNGKVLKQIPEYDDVLKIAKRTRQSVIEVYSRLAKGIR